MVKTFDIALYLIFRAKEDGLIKNAIDSKDLSRNDREKVSNLARYFLKEQENLDGKKLSKHDREAFFAFIDPILTYGYEEDQLMKALSNTPEEYKKIIREYTKDYKDRLKKATST